VRAGLEGSSERWHVKSGVLFSQPPLGRQASTECPQPALAVLGRELVEGVPPAGVQPARGEVKAGAVGVECVDQLGDPGGGRDG
jgi:hypothetical protein